MIGLILILLPVSFAISAMLGVVMGRLGTRFGHLDHPGIESHKHHRRAIPNTGGMAIAVAVVAPIAAAASLPHLLSNADLENLLPPLAAHLPGLRDQWPLALGLLASAVVIHVLGVCDDHRGLAPATKLLVQALAAGVLVVMLDVRVLRFLGTDALGGAGTVISVLATVLWFTVITNAINMLDNMDGLAAGVSLVIAAMYLAATLLAGQWFVAALCAVLMGSLAGFLVHNFPTARLFMGDGGSLLTGWLLAFISVRTTYVQMPTLAADGNWHGVLMPLIVMAVPLYDLSSVVWLRRRAGRSLFAADNAHFSHRLVARGLSRRGAVIVIWLATLATALGGTMLHTLESWQALIIAGQTVVILAILAALERPMPTGDSDKN